MGWGTIEGNFGSRKIGTAYAGFTAGFKHNMTYFMRTIPNLTAELKKLDDVVENEFLPDVTEGHQCTPDERTLFSLPVRIGGMGIPKFSELRGWEFRNSVRAIEP